MRNLTLAILSLLALAASVLPASALGVGADAAGLIQNPPGVGGFMSDNMSYVGSLAQDSSGIGGRVHVMPDGERRYYVSGAQALSIYNIDNPALPVPLGRFEIPNFENEDVSVSKDGKTVLMSAYTSSLYTYIFTVSEPLTPLGQVTITLEGQMVGSGAHIVDCVDDACDYAYGSDGDMYDFTDKANPEQVGNWKQRVNDQNGEQGAPGSGHNVEIVGDYDLDGDGDLERVMVTDTTPMVMLDVTDPMNPILLDQSNRQDHGTFGTQYQHNNKWAGFEDYAPREESEPVTYDEDGKPTNLRTGEVLLGNGETNLGPRCGGGSGPLTAWSTTNWEDGEQFRVIETFRPENGTYDGDGNPAANAVGCSGHWFDTRYPTATELASGIAEEGDIMVAAGWYEHGIRVFRVEAATGHISQLAYFQPVVGSASAAHWVVDGERTYIYTIDYVRGGDVLRFDGSTTATIPSFEDRAFSWTVADAGITELADRARYLCALAVDQQS